MNKYLPILVLSCTFCTPAEEPQTMNQVAESYVRLVLDIGQYDSDFVDAYYGPEEWRPTEKMDEFIYLD